MYIEKTESIIIYTYITVELRFQLQFISMDRM